MTSRVHVESNPENNFSMVSSIRSIYNPINSLDDLRTIQRLSIKQYPSLSEILCGIPAEAKFDIFNDQKERILYAFETSECCERFFCTTKRNFVLHIINSANQEILTINRPFKMCSGYPWFADKDCCSQEITVESPPGNIIGSISQVGSCWRYLYNIKDINGTILTMSGPLCIFDGPYSCCCENKFTIFGVDGITEIGAIYKKYRGFFGEAFSSADAYSFEVPIDLDVRMKGLVLAAVFLIEYMLFSSIPPRN